MSITLRQKRYREVQDSLIRAEEQREEILAKLIRSEAKLKALRKQKDRLKKGLEQVKSVLEQRERIIAKTKSTQEPEPVVDSSSPPFELEIPEWLKRAGPIGDMTPADLAKLEARAKNAEMRDKVAAEAIKAEQAERKKNKAHVRIETMKAKASGETKKMPLTGRAAQEFLRTGKR